MKIFLLTFYVVFTCSLLLGQALPIDFESIITTEDFVDFNGGEAAVISNPQISGINTSSGVATITRDGGEIWAGSKIVLAENLDFITSSSLSMKVYTTAPIGTVMKFKLEGSANSVERDVVTTVSGAWETLLWDFTGTPALYNQLVFMFDYGNIGDGGENSTFLFDDIEQIYVGEQIDFPVDFEGNTVNYTVTDFGGNSAQLVNDPEDESNHVIQVVKTVEAATWAGTTIGTPAGFASDIPLTLTDSKMTVRVWSPEAGTPIRLKVEDSDDPTHTCETEINTTLDGAWEVVEFDFMNEAPGTAKLSFGLDNGWTYNMASIFFNFDTDGQTAGAKTYYFDDVQFGAIMVSTLSTEDFSILGYPNPTDDYWTIEAHDETIEKLELYDVKGQLLRVIQGNVWDGRIDARALGSGMYYMRVSVGHGNIVDLVVVKR